MMMASLRPWPGLPSFSCASAHGHKAWAPVLDVEIDLDASPPKQPERMDQGINHKESAGDQSDGVGVGSPVGKTTDRLYGVLLHHLPSLVVAMLKILLAAGSCRVCTER